MPRRVLLALLLLGLPVTVWTDNASDPTWLAELRPDVERLLQAARADDFAWRRLAELTDTFGHRLSGSDSLNRAAAWAIATMKADGLENVRAEPVMVPRWVRGHESAEITAPPHSAIPILGLGGTVATPPGGIEAEVLAVASFDELRARQAEARGRIVLFNAPFTNYSETVTYRTDGARTAAQYGAVAVLVRSVGPPGLQTPHTGSVIYGLDQRIPAAAVTAEDSSRIVRLIRNGQKVRIRLVTSGETHPAVELVNVIAEIRGREHPEEIVLIGGHLDSWDVGTGASDNAVGCIVTWEAVRLMKALGLRPRRTVRVVLWTNEEHGLRGAQAYAERYATQASKHVFALEADSGVFAPAALGFSGSEAAREVMLRIGSLLRPLGLHEIGRGGGGGPDINPIAQAAGAPTMAYLGDPGRLFVIHHTAADTVDRIAPEEVSKAAAAIAAVTYAVAEMPQRLPK